MKAIRLVLLFAMLAGISHAQTLQFSVEAGPADRSGLPIYVHLEKPLAPGNYELQQVNTKLVTAVQLLDSVTLIFVPQSFAAGTQSVYQLRKKTGPSKPNPVSLTQKAEGMAVAVNGKPLFFYHTQPAIPPADSPSSYQRSGFIHPLFSPTGKILTDDFPIGHAHQHGIFMAWVHTRFRDSLVDFWNTMERLGRVEHVKILKADAGYVMARMQINLRHKSSLFGEILSEQWLVSVYPVSDYFLFDIESDQTNTSTDTLFLEQYRYGGMAYRGSREWNPADSSHFGGDWVITTSEGKDRITANHTHARWVDASGKVGGEMNGLTIFDHPSNFRYPQTMRVHPDMPYWVYAPVVDAPFNIPPGAHYKSRYRYLVHRGPMDVQLVNKIEKDWISNPVIHFLKP